jgi:hypothetical protein
LNEPLKGVPFTEDRSLFFSPITIKHCLLNWAIPGLGYWMIGRKKEGMIISGALFIGILIGVIQGGDLYPFMGEDWLRGIGAVCQVGMGIPWVLAKLFMSRGTPLDITYDYGTNYFLIVGMLNWLGVIDIFDISVKRK